MMERCLYMVFQNEKLGMMNGLKPTNNNSTKKNSNFKYFIAAHAKEWNWNKNKYIFFTDIIHNQFVNYRPADAHTKNSRTETVFRFYANDNKSLPKSRRMNAKKTETKQITRRLNVKNEKRKTHGTRHNHFILFLLLP